MIKKILCLGNEFIREDSFAKKIGLELEKSGFEIVNIRDSFQLMEILNDTSDQDEIIILDVVFGLEDVLILGVDELRDNKIITAHDFDASFVLKLFKDRKFKIIGIPMNGEIDSIKNKVIFHLK